MIKQQCPNCKSFNVKVFSKQKYFRRAAILLAIAIVCFLLMFYLYDYLNKYDNGSFDDRAGILSILLYAVICFFSGGLGMYFLIRGLFIKNTYYKCRYCKYKSVEFITVELPKFNLSIIKK